MQINGQSENKYAVINDIVFCRDSITYRHNECNSERRYYQLVDQCQSR